MLTRLIRRVLWALLILAPDAEAGQQPPVAAKARIFLDCNRCDEDYLKKEITFVDYVRNREDGDVHVLVTIQETGGGGRQWTLKFIGLGPYQGIDQTLVYNQPQIATEDETRAGFAEVLKLGLVRYAANTRAGEQLHVTYKAPQGAATTLAPPPDPWNFWVFRAGGGGDVNGEELQSGRGIRGSFSATRTTDNYRVSFRGEANYRDSEFTLENEDGTQEKILSVSRNLNTSGILVKSLTQHWSLGLEAEANSQTFRNFLVRTRVAPGIEYDIFPYSESTRRLLTIQYTVGYDYHHYREITIYDKLVEQLLDQRAQVGLSMRQPWGSANAEFTFSQYLTQPTKYSLAVDGGAEIRIFKGFSVDFFGEFLRTRDQLYLPRGEASTEEILLRQRQLATGYQFFFTFGMSYSFGSIYNNIVNPRFGGGG
jgi:hypothetical protein